MDNSKKINDSEKEKVIIPFEIPVDGSLGLLALGAVGIKAWRKKRDEAKEQSLKKDTNE
jgi:hypothetical protein